MKTDIKIIADENDMYNATDLFKQLGKPESDLDDYLNENNISDVIIKEQSKWVSKNVYLGIWDKYISGDEVCELDNFMSKNYMFCKLFSKFENTTRFKKKFKTYILLCNNGQCKIGRSVDVSKRIKQIKTGNLNLTGVYIVDRDVEAILHSEYKKNNIHGEWFKLSKSQLVYLKNKYNARFVGF